MNIISDLTKIKRISYKKANIVEKMDMIKNVLADDNSFNKWSKAMSVFQDTRLKNIVAEENVRHQIKFYQYSNDVTLSFKADMAISLISNYSSFFNVDILLQEIYGNQYPELKKQIEENNQIHLEFSNQLLKMPENSSIDDILLNLKNIQKS